MNYHFISLEDGLHLALDWDITKAMGLAAPDARGELRRLRVGQRGHHASLPIIRDAFC
jgi:hypothetical protein